MKHTPLLLAFLFLVACKEEKAPQFTEVSTEIRELSTLSISLDPSGGMPYNLLFYKFGTLVGHPMIRASDGAPAGIAILLPQKDLEKMRVVINDTHHFSRIESFKSIRSPDTLIKAPDLPDVRIMLSRERNSNLRVRSTSIFHDAYYISEFGEIHNEEIALEFLKKFKAEIQNKQVVKAINQLLNRH